MANVRAVVKMPSPLRNVYPSVNSVRGRMGMRAASFEDEGAPERKRCRVSMEEQEHAHACARAEAVTRALEATGGSVSAREMEDESWMDTGAAESIVFLSTQQACGFFDVSAVREAALECDDDDDDGVWAAIAVVDRKHEPGMDDLLEVGTHSSREEIGEFVRNKDMRFFAEPWLLCRVVRMPEDMGTYEAVAFARTADAIEELQLDPADFDEGYERETHVIVLKRNTLVSYEKGYEGDDIPSEYAKYDRRNVDI